MAASDPFAVIAAAPSGPDVGAFFDLDGTLVAGITATAHARERMRRGQAQLGEMFGVLEAAVRYKVGRVHFERLLERAAVYLRGVSLRDVTAVCDRLFAVHHAGRLYPAMQEILTAHRQRGHTIVLSSSALTIHAAPVARALGISELVCNALEVDAHGVLTGHVRHPVIWGAQKAAAVQGFCRTRGVELGKSFFYADGDEDTALMLLVGNPRPVNPRRGLARLARANGWPVLRVAARGRRLT
ncbi:MAG: HAD family hydrolase [Mycobacterium sp.]